MHADVHIDQARSRSENITCTAHASSLPLEKLKLNQYVRGAKKVRKKLEQEQTTKCLLFEIEISSKSALLA